MKDSLEKIEEILDECITFDIDCDGWGAEPKELKKKATSQLKSLISSEVTAGKREVLAQLPKEKELLSMDGNMTIDQWYEELKQNTLKVGYNTALQDIRSKLKSLKEDA